MDVEIRQRWVDALRSGRYTQGHGQLAVKTGDEIEYCCLGVLCHLATLDGVVETTGTGSVSDGSGRYITFINFDYEGATLPHSVRRWAGIKNADPPVIVNEDTATTLATLNDDDGALFDEIADVIEAQL